MNAIPLQRHDDDDVYYPESDGQPMAETDLHLDEMVDLIHALRRRYRHVPDVYVTGNLFFYYAKGDPRSVVAPDVFLVYGVAKRKRRTYKLWEEGRVPSLVIELTSDSTKDEDLSKKKLCYESLGVEEYFLHDPFGDYLDPTLQGFRLMNGRYRPIDPEPDGSLRSLATGLILQVEGTRLRLVDAVTGERLLWDDELDEKVEATERRAAALEEELARLRRKLAEGA
ncbi:MAG: Uma2 family endonuclease [Acidobacteria bacterium]|nr:MAG: Uma2 family endonuclease [Acidobacteriota bacterium]